MPTNDTILFAFGLTLFAGLATGIGSALAFLAKKNNPGFLGISLGFSAGVMIYVSLMEIVPKARTSLEQVWPLAAASTGAVLAFFGGILLMALIDRLVPGFENPHELRSGDDQTPEKRTLLRMGVFSALAIAIHNFPEGLATFPGALENPALGIGIAMAIAIHNIPEGIAVSVPIYYATGDRKKAFLFSFLSGLSEPLGALLGFFFLLPFLTPALFGLVFAAVAGIMVYISFDELLPTAEKYGRHHLVLAGLVAGMAVMAVSLLLFLPPGGASAN